MLRVSPYVLEEQIGFWQTTSEIRINERSQRRRKIKIKNEFGQIMKDLKDEDYEGSEKLSDKTNFLSNKVITDLVAYSKIDWR